MIYVVFTLAAVIRPRAGVWLVLASVKAVTPTRFYRDPLKRRWSCTANSGLVCRAFKTLSVPILLKYPLYFTSLSPVLGVSISPDTPVSLGSIFFLPHAHHPVSCDSLLFITCPCNLFFRLFCSKSLFLNTVKTFGDKWGFFWIHMWMFYIRHF